MDYNFLTNLTLVDTGRLRQPKQLIPEEGLTLRIFSNGAVYPSKELVEKFDLEYNVKDTTESDIPGNGFDIIDSLEWTPTATFPRMILIGAVPKKEAKVDLFSTCRYDGINPKNSIFQQGNISELLLNLVRSMGYLTEDQKYCDLVVLENYPIKLQDGIANVPKLIEKGDRKGERSYERRENVQFFPLNTLEYYKEQLAKSQQEQPATTSNTNEVTNNINI